MVRNSNLANYAHYDDKQYDWVQDPLPNIPIFNAKAATLRAAALFGLLRV